MKKYFVMTGLLFSLSNMAFAEEEPQEELFLREESILSTAGDLSAELGVFFSRRNRITNLAGTDYIARRETSTASVILRYGITQRSQFSLTIPYHYTQDNVLDANTTEISADGVGDLAAHYKYQLWYDSKSTPDLIINFSADSDTGDIGDESTPALGSGHWEYGVSVLAATSYDPAIYFMSLGYRVVESAMYRGERSRPGDSFLYRFGSGFALSDRVIISFQLVGESIQQGKYGSIKIPDSHKISFQFANTLILSRQRFIEPLVSFGLTPESPDILFGVSFPL